MKKALSLAFVASVFAVTSARADDVQVAIDNFAFTPATITVKKGTKITFVNHDDLPHNIVEEKAAFKSKALDTDESYSHVFDKAGEIVYFCGLHPQMKGKVIVTP
ncbi:MAG TPA: cupredoxin family copper-binding protein [Methylocystis sp.]|jgi:plastocyanin